MGRQRKQQICIYCNERKSTSRGDHVPPQGIFPDGTAGVIVSCCYECNHAYSEMDEIMRNKLSFLLTCAPQEVRNSAIRALKNSPAKFSQLETHAVQDREGQERIMIKFNNNPEALDMWFERIIRGLAFDRSGVCLLSSLSFKTTVNFGRLEPPPDLI